MGQYFMVVNLDKRQCFFIGKLQERFRGMSLHQLLVCVWRFAPLAELFSEDNMGKDYRLTIHCQEQSHLLGRLMPELVDAILVQTDVLSSVCLAFSCKLLYNICRWPLESKLDHGSWMGDRLAVFGDYINVDDLPPDSVFNASEQKLIRDNNESFSNSKANNSSDPPRLGHFWGYFIRKRCTDIFVVDSEPHDFLNDVYDLDETSAMLLSRALRSHSRLQVDVQTRDQVLRNLTTREYIRGDAFVEKIPAELGWYFGDILALRICWSSHGASYGLDSYTRGPWTGHRFDIVARSEFMVAGKSDHPISGWTDISGVFLDELLRAGNYQY